MTWNGATRNTVLALTRRRRAPGDVLAGLDRLPDGTTFRTVNEVWPALGHDNETRRW